MLQKFFSCKFKQVTSIFLCFLILSFSFLGCDSGSSGSSGSSRKSGNDAPQIIYGGNRQAANADTNAEGNAKIVSESLSVEYDLEVVDENGTPIEGIAIDYFEYTGQSVFYIFDPAGQHVDGFIMGHPDDMEPDFLSPNRSVQSNNITVLSKQKTAKSQVVAEDGTTPRSVTLTTIALLVTIGSIAYAEVNFILNAYEVQTFYVTDFALAGEGWQMNCKTWDQIAGLIDSRLSATLNLSSILVSFLGAAGGSLAANSIMFDVGMFSADQIRDRILNAAISEWGETMAELQQRSMAVQIFYPEEGTFENVRKLYATYVIHQDHPVCRPTTGALSGTVVDASTAETLSGVSVSIDSGSQITTTNADGQYSFDHVYEGSHALTVSRNGYITMSRQVNISEQTPSIENFALSRTIVNSDEYRIVLTWGIEPRDLDSHIWTPDGSHVYYAQKGSKTSLPYTQLDVDDTSSYGPETITIYHIEPGIYKYSVYNYSGGSADALSNSGAKVELFNELGLVRTWNVPSGNGRWWHVFTLDGITGQATPINTLSDTPQ